MSLGYLLSDQDMMRELVDRKVEERFDWLLPHANGWFGVGRDVGVWFDPGLEVERRMPMSKAGQPAVSPDGTVLALPGKDVLQIRLDGSLEASLPLRPWLDKSRGAAAFSADGARLVVASAGPEANTAEIRAYAANDGWSLVDTTVIPIDIDVGFLMWPHPEERSFLITIGAGQDGQWSWCVREDSERLMSMEIAALRDHGVYDLNAGGTAALSLPWGAETSVKWHEFPSGNLLLSVPPSSLTGVGDKDSDDAVINSIHGLNGWKALIVTEAGKIRLLDCAADRGQPLLLDDASLAPGAWPIAAAVAGTSLLLSDSQSRLHLLQMDG